MSMPGKTFAKPVDVVVVQDEVFLLGNSCSEALTAEAALESAERLRLAAEKAINTRMHPDP